MEERLTTIREFCGKRCAARMRIFRCLDASLCAARLKRNGGSKRNPIPWEERSQSEEGNSLSNYAAWVIFSIALLFYLDVDFLVIEWIQKEERGYEEEGASALWLIRRYVELGIAGCFDLSCQFNRCSKREKLRVVHQNFIPRTAAGQLF